MASVRRWLLSTSHAVSSSTKSVQKIIISGVNHSGFLPVMMLSVKTCWKNGGNSSMPMVMAYSRIIIHNRLRPDFMKR